MGIVAALGSITFEVSVEHINSFSEMSRSSGWTYAEHALCEGKPVLEAAGRRLDEISLKGLFHSRFCSPQDEIQRLNQVADKMEPLELVIGHDYKGKFVITELKETTKNLVTITFEITLKEYN